MKCLFLYNPCSGKGKIKKYAPYIEKRLKEKFAEVDVKPSTCAGEMKEIASAACGVYSVLVFAGGDGSFNEVLNGIADKDEKPVLGYIATGTVNDIAHSLKLPRKPKKAVKTILNGTVAELDVMQVNDAYAEYEISAGALTSCSYKAPHGEKVALGKVAYALEMLRHNMKFEDFTITVETGGETVTTNCEFAVFINSRFIGSMPVNRKAVLDDGEVELLLVKQVIKPRWYHKAAAFFKIINFFAFGYKNARSKRYIKIKGSEFKISAPDSLTWNYDGEEGVKGNIEIKVLRKHIKVFTPKKKN